MNELMYTTMREYISTAKQLFSLACFIFDDKQEWGTRLCASFTLLHPGREWKIIEK